MKALLFAIGVSALVGCTGIRPAGPFVKEPSATKPAQSKPAVVSDPAALAPAPRPAAPTALVMPSEVPIDPNAAAAKLTTELETDAKSQQSAPAIAEVSRYKGMVKQN
ncbi:hypothetical protein [Frigoriglobus tundricola]|uniref:Uncharacterized protein n=1 Tax=Frigoriglobus tundricola TaxID=2774151 RepID=A0A6M5YWU2_9BACT|nr:hypothetical protein [Frigoriglobus tundricola]QJW97970.1 hypothetical protein FTUN_5550 [Frigoriglobus tundricola]